MKRKQSTVILSAAMAAMMLMSGCGKDGGSAQQETATKNADGKYEPTLTITIAKQLDENTGRYGDGEDINNNPMTRLTEEKLGLKMETTLLGGDASNYDTKLRLALTGSEKLPDIFPVYGTQMISDMIESGQVKAIDDDIEKYMPDRLKEIYDKYPETFSGYEGWKNVWNCLHTVHGCRRNHGHPSGLAGQSGASGTDQSGRV